MKKDPKKNKNIVAKKSAANQDLLGFDNITSSDLKSNDLKDRYRQVFGALEELVLLKKIKDDQGKTPEYIKRKEQAWKIAKKVIKNLA